MKKEPKDINRSLRNKYNCSLKNLTRAVHNFENLTKERLDRGGNIRNRKGVVHLLEEVSKLKNLLPDVFSFSGEEIDTTKLVFNCIN